MHQQSFGAQTSFVASPQAAVVGGATGVSMPVSGGASQATQLAAITVATAPSHLTSQLGPNRRLFATPLVMSAETDETILMSKIRELSAAFDLVARKNYDLEIELAYNKLGSKMPPYNVSEVYDIDKARMLRNEVNKLKREIRAAMINQQICTKSRNIHAQTRSGHFNLSQLAMKCQALEQEATSLMSNSNLARAYPGQPMLQSTPVK